MGILLSEKIREDIYYIGTNDRKTELFENMWPLPNGVAYNSYLIKGKENIVFDMVKDVTFDSFIEKVREVVGDEKIDYLVVNHVEPDHSSGLLNMLEIYPDIKIICNKRTISFLERYYNITENLIIVSDGETLEIGGRKLSFYMTPMVHWPESMVCYDEETKILFSQDIFGGFGTLEGGIFDDKIRFDDYYLDETSRYFINIVGKYALQAKRALNKLDALDIETICPVHGCIWRKNPSKIIQIYKDLADQKVEEGVVIVYGSMYGNTQRMAEAVARGVARGGITNIRVRDISKTHLSYILSDVWKFKGIVLGSCTYDNDIFPPMDFLLTELKHQKMKNNIWGFFGSYSWNGGAMGRLEEYAEKNKLNVLENKPQIKGAATREELEELVKLGEEIAKQVLNS